MAYVLLMAQTNNLLPSVAVAAALVGGVTRLAGLLKIKRPALYQWRRVPAERVLAIEEATDGKVTRHQLRPDLYPEEKKAPRKRAA